METEVPPPDRWAVLILRDVLDWPAAEAASLLGVSETTLDRELAVARATVPADESGERERAALARFIGSSDPGGLAIVRAFLSEHARVS